MRGKEQRLVNVPVCLMGNCLEVAVRFFSIKPDCSPFLTTTKCCECLNTTIKALGNIRQLALCTLTVEKVVV